MRTVKAMEPAVADFPLCGRLGGRVKPGSQLVPQGPGGGGEGSTALCHDSVGFLAEEAAD
jgi:hypothetical protein